MWRVHTGVELEGKGVPTMIIGNETYAPMGEGTARQHGYDGLPIEVVPEDFVQMTLAQLDAAAKAMVNQVIFALTSAPEDLMLRYRDRYQSSQGFTLACEIHGAGH